MSEERDSRLEEVLASWFLAQDDGRAVEIEELCGEDRDLAREARQLIDSEPTALRFATGSPLESSHLDPGAGPALERLADFRILGLLGRGGMGTVYLAEQEHPSRRVALKVVDLERLGDRHRRLRFEREANLGASLEHPNIVPVYGIGEENGLAYIAMKRLKGPSLANLELPLEPREVARLGHALASALEEAHLAGVVHRDVKPSNVLLDGDEPVFVDFGLARSITDSTITQEGNVAGTLPYLAPELLCGDAPRLDPRMDVYALGVTLYELLAGRPPFPTEDRSERLVTRILMEEPAPLGLRGEDRDLETIVLKALEKDPRQRIASAGVLARELALYLEGSPITLQRIGTLTRIVRKARRHGRVTTSAAVVLVLFAGLGAWNLRAQAREARALDETLRLVSAELGAERPVRALALLEAPRRMHAEHERVLELAARAEAGAAYDQLMTLVLDDPAALDLGALTAARARLEALDPSARAALPAVATELGLALAACFLEGEAALEGVLAAAPGVRDSRAGRALERWLLGKEEATEPASVDAPGAVSHPDEHLVVARALWFAGRPHAEQMDAVRRAARARPGHARTLFLEARLFANDGREAEALAILDQLLATDFPARPLHRHLARLLLQTGEVEAARRELEAIPVEDWSVAEMSYDLNARLHAQDWSGFDEALARHRERLGEEAWRSAWPLHRLEAEAAWARGEGDEALARLERTIDDCPLFVERDLASASHYRMRVDAAQRFLPPTQEERELLYAELLDEGELLLAELRLPSARGWVLWKHGMTLLTVGTIPDGLGELEQAVELIPEVLWARKELVEVLLNVADLVGGMADDSIAPGTQRFVEQLAWRHARVLDERLRGSSNPRDREFTPTYLALVRRSAERAGAWRPLTGVLAAQAEATEDEELRRRILAELSDLDGQIDFVIRGR